MIMCKEEKKQVIEGRGEKINPTKRNLILTVTYKTACEVRKRLYDEYGRFPELTTVSTFDSYVYNQMILPYMPSIEEYASCPLYVMDGRGELAKLVLHVDERWPFIQRIIARMNMFYDCIFIYEFHKFSGYDYSLVMELAKHIDDIVFSGGYRKQRPRRRKSLEYRRTE